ncbi:hypothetical protein MKZ38_002127 [Zalerion maritima]|uniref:Uncharacterized protein n=1 Tax=Zalerion maritima TaxID=339359 RepID=A0AAD5RQP1_9PEZI|nr:hypothetical protein MKZ38_002127 [Zalerion maritima]
MKLVIEPLSNFDWKAAQPMQIRHFKPIYYISMAISNSTPSEFITMDSEYLSRINLRRETIASKGSLVHGLTPDGQPAVQELYSFLLKDYLPSRFSSIFSMSPDGKTFNNSISGTKFPVSPFSASLSEEKEDPYVLALRNLGEIIDEDIFMLQEMPGGQGHKCVVFVCCFPNGFDPSSKLGKSLEEIHEPVPHYEKIGPSMERHFRRMEVGKSVRRTNWSIQTSSTLYNVDSNHTEVVDTEDSSSSTCPYSNSSNSSKVTLSYVPDDPNIDISQTFLRVELQTLLRLPKTRAIMFVFKTYAYPLKAIKEQEALGEKLAESIDGLKKGNAPKMWTYKGGVRWGMKVKEYLRS